MAEDRAASLDARFMAAAIRLGAEGLGATWPNPAVGALVVKDGRVLGRGRTGQGGRPHGETVALAAAGEAARGATLYVSLEPCAHFGKTPPCTDAIIAAGIARVVAAAEDPDPRVAGQGLARLRAAGIAVTAGVLAREAVATQAGHISRMRERRPHVALKLAVAADGAIGRAGEGNVAVTGERARRHVQALRTRFDAILVGRGTVEADDPLLTCRLPGLEARSPVRVVLGGATELGRERKVVNDDAATWIVSSPGAGEGESERSSEPGEGRRQQPGGDKSHALAGAGGPLPSGERAHELRRLRIPSGAGGGLDLDSLLRRLADEGITRVLVEGGARVARSVLEADLADEVILFRSPSRLGGRLVPALAGLPLAAIEGSERFRPVARRRFGADRMTRYLRAG